MISVVLALIYFFKFLEPAFNKKLDASISDFKYLLLCFIFVGISVFSCFKPIKFKEILELQKIIDDNYIKKENFKNGFVSMSLIKNIIEFNEYTPNNHFYYENNRVFNKEKADKKIGEIFSNLASFINSIYEEKTKENDPEKNFHIFMMLKRIEKDFDGSLPKLRKEDTF